MSVSPDEVTNKDLYALVQSVLNKNIEIQKEIKQNKDILTQELADIKIEFSKQLKDLKKENEVLRIENIDLKSRIDTLEQKLKKYSFVVYGLKEDEDKIEDIQNLLKICNDTIGTPCTHSDFRDIYRIGHLTEGKTRPLIVEAISYHLKQDILKNTVKLKGTGVYIAHDYTASQYKERKILSKYLKIARNHTLDAKIKKNELYIEGEKYTIEDLSNGTPSKITEAMTSTYKEVKNIVGPEKDKTEEKAGVKRKPLDLGEGSKVKRSTRLNSNK